MEVPTAMSLEISSYLYMKFHKDSRGATAVTKGDINRPPAAQGKDHMAAECTINRLLRISFMEIPHFLELRFSHGNESFRLLAAMGFNLSSREFSRIPKVGHLVTNDIGSLRDPHSRNPGSSEAIS